MTSPADDNLKHVGEAAALYGVPDEMISWASETIEGMKQPGRGQAEIRALIDAVLVVAAAHAGPHDECDTCQAVRNGLAVAMGIVRAETNLALTEIFEE